MEYDTKQETPCPMADLAKDIARQRTIIEDNSRQMVDDIDSYIRSYFERTGNDEISLVKNPFKNKFGNTITEIYLTKDNKVLVHGLSYDVELSNINPIEQGLLFEHIVKELKHTFVYVVLEETVFAGGGTIVKIIGTFKKLENAQNALGERVEREQNNKSDIWGKITSKEVLCNNPNEFLAQSSEIVYDIKVIEQIVE